MPYKPSIEQLASIITEEPLGPPESPDVKGNILAFYEGLKRLQAYHRYAHWYIDEADTFPAMTADFGKALQDEADDVSYGERSSFNGPEEFDDALFDEAKQLAADIQKLAAKLGINAKVETKYDQERDWCYLNIHMTEPWQSAAIQYLVPYG